MTSNALQHVVSALHQRTAPAKRGFHRQSKLSPHKLFISMLFGSSKSTPAESINHHIIFTIHHTDTHCYIRKASITSLHLSPLFYQLQSLTFLQHSS